MKQTKLFQMDVVNNLRRHFLYNFPPRRLIEKIRFSVCLFLF